MASKEHLDALVNAINDSVYVDGHFGRCLALGNISQELLDVLEEDPAFTDDMRHGIMDALDPDN